VGRALQTRQQGLEGTGEVRLRDLVRESLRMRPSRVIVGEVRAEECLDLKKCGEVQVFIWGEAAQPLGTHVLIQSGGQL
jgi:hypothetical protein